MTNLPLASNLYKAAVVSAAGMHAQTLRLRVISENLANASSSAPKAGVDPYRRKNITFSNVYDAEIGVEVVGVKKIEPSKGALPQKYSPDDPTADKNGYIKQTDVNALMEMMDLREASRSHDANLKVYQATNSMMMNTIEALKG